MEQNQSVRFIATLVDSMVKEVTERVIANLNEEQRILHWLHDALDNNETFWKRVTDHVVSQMENNSDRNLIKEMIHDWASDNFTSKVDDYMNSHFDISDWFDISNYEDSIKDYAKEELADLNSDDLNDKVREIVNDLTFEVRVC